MTYTDYIKISKALPDHCLGISCLECELDFRRVCGITPNVVKSILELVYENRRHLTNHQKEDCTKEDFLLFHSGMPRCTGRCDRCVYDATPLLCRFFDSETAFSALFDALEELYKDINWRCKIDNIV